MQHKADEINALIKTLVASTKSGLHVSLSPADCRILLSLISQAGRQSRPVLNELLDSVYENLSSVTRTVIEEIAGDLIDKPPRKRK
jgi:hypothetical protein